MLILILLYFIGKKFYDLADSYHKNKWGFAILGVVFYYIGALIFGFILGFILGANFFETTNRFVLALIELPVGILSCYLFYKYLDKKWKGENPTNDLIDQIGKSEE